MTKTKVENIELNEMKTKELNEKKTSNSIAKIWHQILVISIIHLLYIFFEVLDYFQEIWISALIYGLISFASLIFIFLQKEKAKALMVIPFISLVIVGAILESPITITVMFFIISSFFYVLLFLKKDTTQILLTMIFSGLTLFLLTIFMKFGNGFYKTNYEINVVSVLWIVWWGINSAVIILQRKQEKYVLNIVYCLFIALFYSLGPIIRPEGVLSNTFSIICGISLLATTIISILMVFDKSNLKIAQFVGIIIANLFGIYIFSYTFPAAFNWLSSMTQKSLIVDYGLFIPITLFSLFLLFFYYYNKESIRNKTDKYSYADNAELVNCDFIIFGLLAMFLILSQMTFYNPYEYNFIKGLVLSIAFLAGTIPLNIRISTISSFLLSFSFLALVLHFTGGISGNTVIIILMALSSAIILFSILNEVVLFGEPLTTTLNITGTIILMISSMIYFYHNSINYLEIWIGVIWAAIGFFSFIFGIIFNRIFLRRTGLSIILLDILYLIISISFHYRGWQLGVALMVDAIMILGCIILFRWSEKRSTAQKTAE